MDVRCPLETAAYRDEVQAFLAGHLPPAGTIDAGTSHSRRNIPGAFVLGLTKERCADAGSWNEQARA